MPDQLQLRGGTTTEHNSFTGVTREVTVDTTKKTLVVHDGSTAGGKPLMKEEGANSATTVNIGTGGTNALTIDGSQDITFTGASANAVWDKSANALDFADSAKIQLGTGDDLQIYHDGTHSYIKDSGTGNLRIQTNHLDIINAANNEQIAKFVEDGQAELYYDASKKFETYSNGIKAYNHCRVEGAAGESAVLALYADNNQAGTDQYLIASGTDHKLKILGTYDSGWHRYMQINANGGVDLYYDAMDSGSPAATFSTTTNGIVARGNDATGNILIGDLRLKQTSGDTTYIKWDASHTKLEFIDNVSAMFGSGNDLQIYHDGSHGQIVNNTGNLRILADGSGKLVLTSKSGEEAINCNQDGSVELLYDNVKKLETSTNGVIIESGAPNLEIYASTHDADAKLTLIGRTPSGGVGQAGRVEIVGESTATSSGGSAMHLRTRKTNNTVTTAITIDQDQDVTLPNDNQRLRLGASQDLQLYHDGSHSVVKNNTGTLYNISDTSIILQAATGGDVYLKAIKSGAVELYYGGSKKLDTTSSGISVAGNGVFTGNVQINDSQYLYLGNNGDLQISHDGTYNRIEGGSLTTLFRSNTIELGDSGGNLFVKCNDGGAVELYHQSGSTATKRVETDAYGIHTNGRVSGKALSATDSTAGYFNCYVIDLNQAAQSGETVKILAQKQDCLDMVRYYTSGVIQTFRFNNDFVGSISVTGSATAYNTSSDYRLKENEVDISDGIARVKQLKPYKYNFKADPTTTLDGFFAHEVDSIVPGAVEGEKDATKVTHYHEGDTIPDGKSIGDVKDANAIKSQQLDYSKLVPLLTAALKEAIAKIETLETKVAALEAA